MSLFNKTIEADEDGFYDTAVAPETIESDMMKRVRINKSKVVLTRHNGELHAFNALCPHAAADLANGDVARGKVICPDHGYCFDLQNGRILYPSDEVYRLKKYAVKVKNGRVLVRLETAVSS